MLEDILSPRVSPLSGEQRLHMSYWLLESVQKQIEFADEKIRGLFGANALLAAALAFSNQKLSLSSSLGINWINIALQIIYLILLYSIAFSTLSSILALLPRRNKRSDLSPVLFFGHIAGTPLEMLHQEISVLSLDQVIQELTNQAHITSEIVEIKYKWTRRAANSLFVAICCWMIIQLTILIR